MIQCALLYFRQGFLTDCCKSNYNDYNFIQLRIRKRPLSGKRLITIPPPIPLPKGNVQKMLQEDRDACRLFPKKQI
jgi:hypothetical protein